MIINFKKEGYFNKALIVETVRRAIVRNAREITLSRPNNEYWRLFIENKGLNKKQEQEIKRYIH